MSITLNAAGTVAKAANGNVTPALPAGWLAEDIHLCVIASGDNVNSRMPAGWTPIEAGKNNGMGLRWTCFWKRAEGGDTDPVVTHPAGANIVAQIAGFRGGASLFAPIDAKGVTQANTSSATVSAPGISTVADGAMVIFLGAIAAQATFSGYGNDPALTEAIDSPNTAAYPSLFLAYGLQATAGEIAAQEATASAAAVNIGLLLSLGPRLTDFQAAVAERIQDSAGKLATSAITGSIREAITGRYSQARPLTVISDFAGDSSTYKWTLNTTNFPGWDKARSVVTQVEYPQGERDPVFLESDEWAIYPNGDDAAELRMTSAGPTPATGETLRVTYTIPRAEDGSDVPASDFDAVANLAASLAARRLSALYTQLGDASFGAESVDYRSKNSEYASLAKALELAFKQAFGMDQDTPQPAAGGTAHWGETMEDGGERMTH